MINRTHVWFAAFVLIVFAGGLAAGVAIDRAVWHGGRGPGPGGFRGDRLGGPGRDGRSGEGRDSGRGGSGDGREGGRGADGPPTEAFVRELDQRLNLSPEQEAKVTEIINASRPEMRALQEDASKKFAGQQQSLQDAIVKVLSPEQAKKFEETPRGPFGFRWRGGRGGR